MLCQPLHGVNAIQGVETRAGWGYDSDMDVIQDLRKKRRSLTRMVVWGGVLVLVVFIEIGFFGCSRPQKSERTKRILQIAERKSGLDPRDTVVPAVPDAEVLALVHESPAPDGEGNTTEWVRRSMDSTVQKLFPRWQVVRRGATRYEVKYTYTVINTTNELTRQGYAWNVDAALKTVGPPVLVSMADPLAPLGRTFSQQQRRRIQDEEASLE